MSASPSDPRVVVVDDATSAATHAAAWEELERHALDDNVYASPAYLLPALRHQCGLGTRVAFVYASVQGRDLMVACATFQPIESVARLPFAGLSTRGVPHGYLGLPLVDRRFPAVAVGALQSWLDAGARSYPLTVWGRIPLASATWAAIQHEAERRGRSLWLRHEFRRPMIGRGSTFEQCLARLSKSRRKGYRRNWRKLEALGAVTVNVHRDMAEAPDLAARFMDLEGSGWKSTSGTALACKPASAAFFGEAVAELGSRGRLLFVEIQLDGRPIAMTANFVHGGTMFAFKIAFAKAFAHLSPGILAEIETLRAFLATPELNRGDSGTGANSYIASYWLDSAPMGEVVIAAGGSLADRTLRMMPVMRRLRRSAADLLSA